LLEKDVILTHELINHVLESLSVSNRDRQWDLEALPPYSLCPVVDKHLIVCGNLKGLEKDRMFTFLKCICIEIAVK
jgi:hypothetical protein